MEDESTEREVDSYGIVKPLSAYFHFVRSQSSVVRDRLQSEGKEIRGGGLISAISAEWKALSDHDRAQYEDLALEDKERYQDECARRDEEVLQQQEERRKANSLVPTDTRMRGSTLANTGASTVKAEGKRKREQSEKEKEITELNRQRKKVETDAMNKQMNELHSNKAEQAEARLKYLLSQSDIFSHFGATKGFAQETKLKAEAAAAAAGESSSSSRGRRRRSEAAVGDMDEDEKAMAMAEEIDEADEEGGVGAKQTTVLVRQPSIVNGGDMRSYQVEGLNWMIRLQENGINGILADEMGLGKTLQSISILAYMKEFKNVSGPHLIMVPKSTLSNWCNEFKRWCPSLRVLRFHGTKEERMEIIQNKLKPGQLQARDWDVVITTYEIVNLEKHALIKLAWKYLIIDEAHRLKNEDSQFSQTVRLLNTNHRLLLTGTPLQNNLHELWALLNFLLPDVFASSEQFDEWFNLDVDDTELKQRMIGQLHKLLRPFMLRRLKADVEKSLPPKTETILFTGMSVMQKNLYRQILMRDIDNISNNSNSQQSRTAILNIVMQLRKCCNHPYLFPGMEDRMDDPYGDHLQQNCGKMVLLDKLLRKLKERDHRVLVFSQMTRMLDILEDYLIAQGYQYCRIDGNTSYEDREDRIFDFNRPDSDKFIFILSTRAGGLGINLQTADTVILYDSDWNPQADLQAQDRAHRIGQKKRVQVFRLVTDDTVEVKVVERAQQKLKLDAMVVQQGRLQEKEKKMTKNDLLETIRFGADKIFRTKESSITDADIDTILEEGRKRTEELEKLQAADKGDIYDFRLDGGMSAQMFEGKDYADKNNRTNAAQELSTLLLSMDAAGRRDRKVVGYSETNPRGQGAGGEETEKRQKLPKHLRLGKLEDWQFFDRLRLTELQNEEIRMFDEIVDRGEAPQMGYISKFVVLPADLHAEKQRLLADGFGEWTRVHFNNFVRASAKHGRHEYEKIAKDVGRSVDEIRRYCAIFWTRGEKELQPAEWERVVKAVEKGEKRLEEISRLTAATAKLIGMFDDPWEELTFRNIGNVNKIFTSVEDRYLLCLTHLHGYGSWDQVRNSIRRCERFRFDFYLQSCSAEALGKRCEMLMRSAERELSEIEKKRQMEASQAAAKNASDVARLRVTEINKQMEEETRKLTLARAQMKKLRAELSTGTTPAKSANVKAEKDRDDDREPAAKKARSAPSASNAGSKAAGTSRPTVNAVPPELYPALCRIIIASTADGIQKVVDRFLAEHSSFPKRQIEIAIEKLAFKERRTGDSTKVWYIKPEFEHLLRQETPAVKISGEKRSREDSEDATSPSKQGGQPPKEPKKFKRAFGFFVKDHRAEAEAQLGPDKNNAERLRDLLTRMWDETDGSIKKVYEKREQEDVDRYHREKAEWDSWNARNTASSSSTAKKAKVGK